ncbi:MAG TPA: transposase [Leadbetterella sp.]|nr:transposase [Leadbetterella sp.]
MDKWRHEYEIQKRLIIQTSAQVEKDLDTLHKRNFVERDKYLDLSKEANTDLNNPELAQIVVDSINFWDGNRIDLICYCIMSNHVHLVFRLLDKTETDTPKYLEDIMHSIKQFSAKKCNAILNRKGDFWQHESYDRLIRNDEELFRIVLYVLNNPVKAGLCKNPFGWKWTYLQEKFKKIIL